MLSVRFNTREECPRSFITLEQASSIKKLYCLTTKIAYNNYTSFCHTCSIDSLSKETSYEYMAYGWTGSSSDPAIPFRNQNFKSHLIKEGQPVKMLTLGDWGYL